MFTDSWLQTATYLFAVCPFSIAFLVFINSSMSFVVTDLIDLKTGEGDAVGSLGFADELLALVACPVWGMISDRIGARYVCTIGYAIIALSLVLFVQARNLYPELLLGRLLFCIGGSAAATMVTAILPSITAGRDTSNNEIHSSQNNSGEFDELPAVPNESSSFIYSRISRIFRSNSSSGAERVRPGRSAPRLAGFVGMLTGCGALISLFIFLPLPARFQRAGYSPAQAVKMSFYIVGAVAFVISVASFFGLRGLYGDEGKSLKSLLKIFKKNDSRGEDLDTHRSMTVNCITSAQRPGIILQDPKQLHPKSFFAQFTIALKAGVTNSNIGLAYLGGFVARSTSVGISLFIPLYVNRYYRHSGLCHEGDTSVWSQLVKNDIGDVKKSCPRAYVVASILTGVSQLVALICAPLFGYLSDKSRIYNFPLLAGAVSGVVGYVMLASLPSPQLNGPHGNAAIFIDMIFIGINQIGAIVCSLAILSNGVLPLAKHVEGGRHTTSSVQEERGINSERTVEDRGESSPLLTESTKDVTGEHNDLVNFKGSIAGMYSLWGGAGILILTKLGGLMFDKISPQSPFYILVIFNGLLLISGLIIGLRQHWNARSRRQHRIVHSE